MTSRIIQSQLAQFNLRWKALRFQPVAAGRNGRMPAGSFGPRVARLAQGGPEWWLQDSEAAAR